LRHYVMTPSMSRVFSRVIEGVRPGSGHRAWRITGDYGTGKSSFALVLAHLLREPEAFELSRIRRFIEPDPAEIACARLHPVLITGARESLITAIARGVSEAVSR